MTTKPRYATIGSVSEGTMRDEDLISSFTWELEHYLQRLRLTRDQRKQFTDLVRECNDWEPHDDTGEDGSVLVGELFDALDEIAPPHCYFGASDGDGASYGFWPYVDNDELPRFNAGDEIPREHWREDIYIITDHGNVTCGYVNGHGKLIEYWSCV